MPKAIEGIFLRPTEEQSALIWEAVRDEGLPENGEGILQLLMVLLTGEETHPSQHAIFQYFKAHPEDLETVKALAGGVGPLAANFLGKIFGVKKPGGQ